MHLLRCDVNGRYSLQSYTSPESIPPYAILSHTWGPQEVEFGDLFDTSTRWQSKLGFEKIRFCGEQAQRHGLEHFWVDTCCINTSNKAEHSAAIRSMFRWYQNAARCYVYLSDVLVSGYDGVTQQPALWWKSAFRNSRWFTRGWTLQELLAPASVEFFTKEGVQLGDKTSLEEQIHEITGIAIPALRGSTLSQFSTEERFRWAEKRQTERKEDWAYCLQGIFGVSMAVTYGEGESSAINRLHEEIKSRSILNPVYKLNISKSKANEDIYWQRTKSV